jgi:hypothetical protein
MTTELSRHRTASIVLICAAGFVAGIIVSAVEPYWFALVIVVVLALLTSLTAELFLRWRRRRSPTGE